MHHPNPLLSLSHDQRSTPPRLTIRERKCLKRFFNEVYSPGSFYQVNGTRTPRPHHRQAPIRQHPRIKNVYIYQAVQKEKKTSGVKEIRINTYISKEAKSSDSVIFPQPLRVPERAPPPQWIWSLWYLLFPSFQAAAAASWSVSTEWHNSEILRRSGFSGAATLLPGGGGILDSFH